MPKVHRAQDGLYMFECPGCGCCHFFSTDGAGRPHWQWNGDVEKPTVTPSILVSGSRPEHRCHSFVKDGRIQFLGDCHHKLAGQTVDLPEWGGLWHEGEAETKPNTDQ